MKKELQSNVNAMTSGGGSIQHPLSIHSASIGSRWKVHGLQSLMMTILLLFTMGIGQMWGADPDLTVTFDGSTYGDYVKNYSTKGITLTVYTNDDDAGVVQTAFKGNLSGHYYVDIAKSSTAYNHGSLLVEATQVIDSISIFWVPNTTSKDTYFGVVGWNTKASTSSSYGNTVDTLFTTTVYNISTKNYDAAKWETLDLSSSSLKALAFSRKFPKKVFTYKGSLYSSNFGGEQTLLILGVKVWLHPTTPSCAAGAPGNISKGTLSAGVLTLNAAGSAASGDTWYWQTAADGTSTANSGSSFDVSAAGTYYIRSYNTAAECWSDAKSITVAASDLVAHYIITYSKGTYGTGEAIEDGDKVHGEDFTLSSSTYTRANYRQTGWSTTDGGAKAYDLGGTYSTDADEELFPFWTPVYTVTKGTHANGDFTISPASQVAGGTVTLDPTPADGYMFSAWEIVKTSDASATGITVTNKQFEMPAYGVTVNATFVTDTRKKILYLTTTNEANTKANDKLYAALKDDYKVTIAAPDAQTLTNYDLVVLHESINGKAAAPDDADNRKQAVLDAKTTSVPVLNTKTYFYNSGRWGWGTPNNGQADQRVATLNSGYCNITDHPIFNDVTISAGAVTVLANEATGNTMQPVVPSSGKEGYLLATTPNKEGGESSYAIQEIPAGGFRGASSGKYILISVSNAGLNNLTADGQKLFQNAAAYLTSATTWTPVAGLTNAEIDATGNPFSEGATMTLTASATGATAATTYAWYKGATWPEAEAGGAIQAAKTAENSGHIYTKTAAAEDAGKYWCVMVKSTGCEVTASVEVSVLTCTKPEAPASLVASDIAYTSATLSWDPSGAGANGYKIALIKKDDESVILDWTDESTNSYFATGLTQGTEYTFKVKYKGDGITPGQCEFSNEVTVDFTTTAPSVADLVTIADDYTFTPSASIPAGTLSADSKFFAAGTGDCDISGGKMRVKTNRALAFKVADGAKIKVTFTENGSRQIQLGTALSEGNYDTYGYSTKSPYTFNVVSTGGVVYLTAQTDQLYFSKLEITYPHTVTYDLNGGTGDPAPTQASKYVGETFTAHDGVTGITAPATKEFDKWVDQDAADVAAGTTYTMPAKNVTLTAQWRNETVKYSVTYDLDDYTSGVAPTETDKAEGDVFAIKAAPERESYDFLGWLCDIDAHTYQATNNYTMTAAPTTFTAQWQQFFTITYKDGSTTLGTEKVNVGDSPAGIADPTKELYSFVGWTLVQDGDVLVDPTTLDASTTVYAKWTAFDGCTYLAPETSGGDLTIGATVDLKGASFGGSVKVANLKSSGSIAYHENGLYFTGGDKDSIRVTLGNKMKAGTKITVRLQTSGTGNHGLKLQTLAKANVATLGWSDAAENAVGSFTYTVVADDGLDGTKAFLLERSGSVYLKYISVEDCAPEEFVVTYKDGSTTMGTEDVFKNNHPTATGIATRKNGYVFQGWSETDGGSVVNLDDITITADKNLYAVYSARVCATSGSIYKFEVATGKVNGNILPSAPASMALTTDNYLASLSGGELEASVTGNNNRLQYVDSKGISFPNGDGGTLTIKLDCPLKENDEIRFINYASNGNGITLSDGVNTMTLNSNNSMDVQTLSVPEAWETEGSYELTMVRVSSKTPKITYFEIYRRPALEGVTVADLTVREGASITPVMTLTPSDALVTSQAWSILSGSDKISINATTGAVTGEAVGDAEIKVVLNEDPLMTATATVHVVETFAQQDVDESIVWDFSKAGVVADAFTGQVLANVDGVTLDASQFDARKLVGTAQNITSTYFQGTMLTFNATEAGRLSVRFTNGNANVRTLKVYVGDPEVEVAAWSYSNAATENKSIEVPAGKVTLRSYQGDAPNNVRIMNLEFLALAHQRTTGYAAGDLGTVCLEDVTIIDGANLYELAGLDQYGYLAFDQILSGELQAGKPYLFEVTNPSKISFYKPVGAAHSDDEIAVKGMIGTFAGTTLSQNVAQNYYYFSGRHIWRVNDFTVAIPIPAHRCYVDMDVLKNAVASSPLPGRRRVTLGVNGKNAPTAIDNAEATEEPRKVMINGTLFILRGEKMYDATGRLVK